MAFRAANAQLTPAGQLQNALFQHAAAVLKRDGTTFYALGMYRDSAGAELQLVPEHWPALDAPPAAWEDSLRSAMARLPRSVFLAAILVDQTRPVSDGRKFDGTARFWIGARNGPCRAELHRYHRNADLEVRWFRLDTAPCRSWPAAR